MNIEDCLNKNVEYNGYEFVIDEKLKEFLKKLNIEIKIYMKIKDSNRFYRYIVDSTFHLSINNKQLKFNNSFSVNTLDDAYSYFTRSLSFRNYQFYNILKNEKIFLWARVLNGKYKNSIGKLNPWGVEIINPKTNREIEARVKKVELLYDYTGHGEYNTSLTDKKVYDLFGKEIDKNDLIVYALNSELEFGRYIGYDIDRNHLMISSTNGTKRFTAKKVRFLNITKSDEEFMSKKLFIEQLKNNK